MKIISKQHDYYDTVQAYGVDNHVIFNREISKLKETFTPPLTPFESSISERVRAVRSNLLLKPFYNWNNSHIGGRFRFIYLAFCGDLYPIIQVNIKEDDSPLSKDEYKSCYGYSDVQLALSKIPDRLAKEITDKTNKQTFIDFFQSKPVISPADFVAVGCPYFRISVSTAHMFYEHPQSVRVSLLPNLGDLSFFKQKDPFTAYQDIEQYISGVLCDIENDIPVIADEFLIKSKGFFEKSFKHRSPTKKRKMSKLDKLKASQ